MAEKEEWGKKVDERDVVRKHTDETEGTEKANSQRKRVGSAKNEKILREEIAMEAPALSSTGERSS